MKTITITAVLVAFLFLDLKAQDNARSEKLNAGLEQDFLPYATGGYYAGLWVGKNKIRVRALTAKVNKPAFITPKGFDHNSVNAYAILGEYFLKPGWTGLSASAGLVYWKSEIQREGYSTKVGYENVLLNGSLSYTIKIYQRFYISPWAGLHVRVGGAKEVSTEGKGFVTPVLNPEASVKVGWWF